MKEKENGNAGLIILVCLLLIVCAGMGTFIIINKDKLAAKENTSTTEESVNKEINNNTEKEIDSTKTNGECPLTKFDSTYVLTDTDKEEIITSLEIQNIGFTKEKIDINTMAISSVADSGYYLNVKFDLNPKTSGTYASVAKVNNKFKVLIAGSGDTVDGVKRMEYTLQNICK